MLACSAVMPTSRVTRRKPTESSFRMWFRSSHPYSGGEEGWHSREEDEGGLGGGDEMRWNVAVRRRRPRTSSPNFCWYWLNLSCSKSAPSAAVESMPEVLCLVDCFAAAGAAAGAAGALAPQPISMCEAAGL